MCSQPKNVNFVKYGDELVDHQMKQFLRLEDFEMNRSSKKGMSIKDQEALKRMEKSVCIVGGHYEVGMLWKSDTPWLPNNKQTVEARLQSLKRKLKRDENFHRKYRELMENLIQKGYARKMTEEEMVRRSQRTWYLPHHGVFHPQKQGKIRVVFDAASLHDGVSLNNQLLQGPGKVNPANDASRGLKPPKPSCQHRWWRGPEFLWEAEECWPGVVTYGEVPDSDPEMRISATVHLISVETRRIGTPTECRENDNASQDNHAGLIRLIESCSSWLTLQRRVAWIVRFCQWVADKRIAGSTGPLTLEELNQST